MSKKKNKKQPEQQVEEIIGISPPTPAEIKPLKMSFVKLAFAPFAVLVDNFQKVFVLTGFYAVILSVLSLATGFGYICKYSQMKDIQFYCSESKIMLAVYYFLTLFLFSLYTVKYYSSLFKKTPLSIKDLVLIDRKVLKAFLLFLLFIATYFLPFVSLYLLVIRVPNPNWVVETVYFAVVSIGFIIPFLMMRFYSYIAFFAEGEKIPKVKDLWILTSGNGIKILFSMLLIFILVVFILFQFYVNFMKSVDENVIYVGIISTFLYNFVMLMVFSIFINHCAMQKQIIFKDIKDE